VAFSGNFHAVLLDGGICNVCGVVAWEMRGGGILGLFWGVKVIFPVSVGLLRSLRLGREIMFGIDLVWWVACVYQREGRVACLDRDKHLLVLHVLSTLSFPLHRGIEGLVLHSDEGTPYLEPCFLILWVDFCSPVGRSICQLVFV
jgi:hypothetical protein